MPLPAHPLPGSAPPHSTQRIPSVPSHTGSADVSDEKVLMLLPPVNSLVESCFGSHPTWSTLLPSADRRYDRLADTVDLPIPPFP